MLSIKEFSNLIIEYIEKSLISEDNADSFAYGVIVPYLSGEKNEYMQTAKNRQINAMKIGDRIDEGSAAAFGVGVQRRLRKKWPSVPKGEDPKDFDFYDDNKGIWYNFAVNYYNTMTAKGLTKASNQTQRAKSIGNGSGKNSKFIHDSGLEGSNLTNNTFKSFFNRFNKKSVCTEENYFDY